MYTYCANSIKILIPFGHWWLVVVLWMTFDIWMNPAVSEKCANYIQKVIHCNTCMKCEYIHECRSNWLIAWFNKYFSQINECPWDMDESDKEI